MSADDVISALNHSLLPTLISEGHTDVVVLRRLEAALGSKRISVLPVGGRKCVLEVFRRRNELTVTMPVAFIADRDIWVHSELPGEYQTNELFFTDGYSIENDLYRDGRFERLLTAEERDVFKAELAKLLQWYALALARHFKGQASTFSDHPNALLDDPVRYEDETSLSQEEQFPAKLFAEISAEYPKLLRGKTLMALILRQLSHRKRNPKHKALSLLELGATSGGVYMKRIREWAENIF